MSIDCCKSYVGKQIIGLLPSEQDCLYYLVIDSYAQFGVSNFTGFTINGQPISNVANSFFNSYQSFIPATSETAVFWYTGTQPDTIVVVDPFNNEFPFTYTKVTDLDGGSCDPACYQASFDYGYVVQYFEYFTNGGAYPATFGGISIDDESGLQSVLAYLLGPDITVSSVWNGSQYVVTINGAFALGSPLQFDDGAGHVVAFDLLPCEITPPTPVPLDFLTAYPGAGAAYSVRKLSSSYGGAAVRVRRSSDNTEQDIGFVGFDLDTTALTSFVGAGSGFITRWYDQSGNGRNMTQTTAGLQPSIVSGGTIITRNGNVSIYFNISFNIFLTSAYSFSNGPISSIQVVNASGNSQSSEFGLIHNNVFEIGRIANVNWGYLNFNLFGGVATLLPTLSGYISSAASIVNNDTYLCYTNWNGNTTPVKYRRNAIAATPSANSGSSMRTGTGNYIYRQGYISELIIYQSDQASNVAGMELNINTYYNIYP
jgi:hypothetical protein